ncbi:MAG: tetratricopeptide repeat protein [Balneolaceae bacterium]
MQALRLFFFLLFCLFQPLALWGQEASVTQEEETRAMESFIRGISEFENEEYERALDYLTAAHLKLSEHAGVNYALADVYLATGDLINAAYYGQMAANLEPENKWYHLKLAEVYRRAGRNKATVDAYNRALEFHPHDMDILFDLAETYTDFGELLEANKMYDHILKIKGSDFELHLRKFQNFNALKMRDSALVQLEIMRDLNPGNLSTLHTLSQYYLELDDEETARNILLEAHKRNARDPQTLILLADIYIRNSEWGNLGEAFSTMLKDPLIYPSQKLELVRFIYLEYQKQPDEPVLQEQTRNVILDFSESEPEYGPAQIVASEFFLQINEPEIALETLERVNTAVPEEQEPWRQRMQILFSRQDYQEVIRLSEPAVGYVPDDAYILFFTGASYMLTGEPEKAEEWLEEASMAPARRSFRSVVYGTLGDIKQGLDKWDEAVRAYERAIRLDSGNHNAMNNYAYYLSVRDERLEDARELSETALQMEPENTSYLDTMGWILYKLGNYEEALEYIQRAAANDDASAEVFEHLGDVFNKKGDHQKAADWWERAIEEDSTRDYLKERIQTRD